MNEIRDNTVRFTFLYVNIAVIVFQYFLHFQAVLLTYSGSRNHLHYIWRIPPYIDQESMIAENMKVKETLAPQFPVYHSRAMCREFIQSFGRAMHGKAAFLREAYRYHMTFSNVFLYKTVRHAHLNK